jgi:WD40 repeat protein
MWVTALALAPDGKRAALGTNTLQLWDMEAHRPLHDFGGKDFKRIECLAWSSDSRRLVVGTSEAQAVILEAETGKVVTSLGGHTTPVRSAAFSADGRYLLTGAGADAEVDIRRWDVASGRQVGKYQGARPYAQVVAFGADEKTVLASVHHMEPVCYEWDLENGDEPRRIPLPGRGDYGKWFSPDGRAVARLGHDHMLHIHELPSGKELRRSGVLPQANGVRWSRDGQTLACGSFYDKNTKSGGLVYLLDAATCKELRRCAGANNWVMLTESGPGGRSLIASAAGGVVRSWHDLDRDAPPPEKGPFSGHDGPVYSVAFSADGKRIVSGGWDHTVRVWDVTNGSEVQQFLHDGTPYRAAFAGKGDKVVGGGRDMGFKCWDLETGKQVNSGNFPRSSTEALSPDGENYLLFPPKNSVLPRRTTAREAAEPQIHGKWEAVRAAAFAPDGRSVILAGGDGLLHVLNMTAHSEVGKGFQGPRSPVVCLAISPKGTYVVTAAEDRSVTLWKWSELAFTQVRRFTGNKDRVNCLTFSPDGKHVAGGGADATVHVWDLGGTELARSADHKEAVQGVAFSPDGKTIAACGGGIRLWEWQARAPAKP